jgi:hypothetical protein
VLWTKGWIPAFAGMTSEAHAAMHQDGARPLSLGATWEFAINRLGGQSVGATHNVMNS